MKSFIKILIDTVPVILGVLIALFINNWNQTSKDKKFLNQIYSNIDKEMISNLEECEAILPEQTALMDSLHAYRLESDASVAEIFMKTDGLRIPAISNTSWNSFLNSKLELVDFEVIRITTAVEEYKGLYNSKVEKLQDVTLDNLDSTDPKVKSRIILLIRDLQGTEEELANLFTEYSEWMKNRDD